MSRNPVAKSLRIYNIKTKPSNKLYNRKIKGPNEGDPETNTPPEHLDEDGWDDREEEGPDEYAGRSIGLF